MKYCKSSRFLFFPLTCLWVKGDSKVLHKVFFPSFFSLRNCSMFTQLSTHIHSHTKRIKKSNILVQVSGKILTRAKSTNYLATGWTVNHVVFGSMLQWNQIIFFFCSVHKTLLNYEKRSWFNGNTYAPKDQHHWPSTLIISTLFISSIFLIDWTHFWRSIFHNQSFHAITLPRLSEISELFWIYQHSQSGHNLLNWAELAVLFSRQLSNGSQDFFFSFQYFNFHLFFKYKTIETHTNAFWHLIFQL